MKTEKTDKLSQEVSMAIAAGMSYGKWKAMQPEKTTKAVKKIPEGMKECPHCGKLFTPHNGKHKFCEPYCRIEASYEKQREQKKEWQRKKRLQKKTEAEKDG